MYYGYITKLKDVRAHSNADRLNLATCFDSTVVIDKTMVEGQTVVYFPVDGQLSEEFCKINDLVRRKDADGNDAGGFLDPKKRNIKAIRLRGEKSDGLVMPLECLEYTGVKLKDLQIGDKITVVNGHEICQKYIPRTNKQKTQGRKTKKEKRKVNEFPLFEEHKDTEQLDYNIGNLRQGELCTMTLKMHGTSGRTAYLPSAGTSFWTQLLRKFITKYKYITGTRRVVLQNYDGGYYGNNAFRKKYHDFFKGKLEKGETVYYEIVGYMNEETPIMAEGNNKKVNDKEFLKKYGETTVFNYGCAQGENQIYVYRMTSTNVDGDVIEYPWSFVKRRCEEMGVNTVPELDRFFYNGEEDLYERVNKYLDIEDPIGKTHVSEGVVIRLEDRPIFTAYKKKGFFFKVLEGLIKETADAPDIEEAQEL